VTTPPEEPPGPGPDDLPTHGSSDEGDVPLRGWIDPDDRLWRHPSEVAGRAPALVQGRSHESRGYLMFGVGAAATVAAVAWLVVLLSSNPAHAPSVSTSAVSADSPMTTLAGNEQTVPAVAQSASHSMVQLRADTSHGVVLLTGVAVAEGGLVATTADALEGLRSLSMIGPGGKFLSARLMGEDDDSDVALITVPDDLPVAPFADDLSLSGGSPDWILTLVGSDTGTPTLHCETGLVAAVGNPVSDGPASGMPAIVSATPGAVAESGDPLLNSAGSVVGLLYENRPATSGPATVTFLPSQLILGVADDLRSTGKVVGGWLGVTGVTGVTSSTGSSAAGAMVTGFSPGSPAAGSLHAGEMIVGVNSIPVRTMAELRSRVYVLAPNSPVQLSVLDGSVQKLVDVTLGTSS
jgi:S1-C subfamily serine protease